MGTHREFSTSKVVRCLMPRNVNTKQINLPGQYIIYVTFAQVAAWPIDPLSCLLSEICSFYGPYYRVDISCTYVSRSRTSSAISFLYLMHARDATEERPIYRTGLGAIGIMYIDFAFSIQKVYCALQFAAVQLGLCILVVYCLASAYEALLINYYLHKFPLLN